MVRGRGVGRFMEMYPGDLGMLYALGVMGCGVLGME